MTFPEPNENQDHLLFSQIEIGAGPLQPSSLSESEELQEENSQVIRLLQELLRTQAEQNKIMSQMLAQMTAQGKQRVRDLKRWQESHPYLAASCRDAANKLGHVQAEFLQNLTDQVDCTADDMLESDYAFSDFVEKFGPKMLHLNGILQMLGQLGSQTAPPTKPAPK